MIKNIDDRFNEKVLHGSDDECWFWSGALTEKGYGRFSLWSKDEQRSSVVAAHRYAYKLANGEIPEGLVIDHTCHNADLDCEGGPECEHRRCVNPSHLRAVTPTENTLDGRGSYRRRRNQTHCVNGHLLSGDNLFLDKRNHRHCRECAKANGRRHWKKKRLLSITGALLLVFGIFTGCTSYQIEVFKSLNPDQQQAVLDYYSRQHEASQRSTNCNQAINKYWHGDKAWARKIVWRESRNNPAAANPRSSARGCTQLLQSYHAKRYYRVGCSPSQWANPDCNIKAAWTLYQEQGPSPWRLTNY